MKRKQFQIASSAGHNVIKSTWNASIREIVHHSQDSVTPEARTVSGRYYQEET